MRLVVRLLGPLEVQCAGRLISIGAPKERVVVVLLALNAGRVVPIDRLVDAVWGEDPPESAAVSVRVLVSRLRKALAAAGHHDVIRTVSPGYVMVADAVDVDAHQFRVLAADGVAQLAGGSAGRAAATFRAALALWRGDRLAEAGGSRLTGEAARLAEARLAALEARIDADLACGRHVELVSELEDLCRAHPMRERLWGQRMQALYRCGRQADALAAYRQLRTTLADELGLDPSGELRRLEAAILAQDPALTGPDGAQPQARSGASAELADAPVPRQLPSPPRCFTGRDAELARLDALLDTALEQPRTVVISAVSGTAGAGKTALAVHWAHAVADRFPDGQLYVNLRGFDPTGTVMSPAEALRGFLDALAVQPQRIPANLDAQAALYRSLLAGKRMLVLLDNARDAEHIRLLLPGSPGCLVLVTSRSQLTSLVAVDGAHPLLVDLLSPEESRQLLSRRLRPDRLAAEPQAVAEIITWCARLPLALTIVAARAATHPHLPLQALAGELREARDRLDVLTGGDPASDARAVFSWSYRALTAEAARLFRLLGLHPGPDISAAAAASCNDHERC